MSLRRKSKASCGSVLQCCFLLSVIVILSTFSLMLISIHSHNESVSEDGVKDITHVTSGTTNDSGSSSEPNIGTPNFKSTHYPVATIAVETDIVPITEEIHFIHIPKCGGTTMTTLLRQLQCHINPVRNADCCVNPGFCDWNAHRRCSSIKGCINHFPNRKFIYKAVHSIAVFREPISRLLSAFFYRGHSPNLDFFQVRPEFKLIKEGKKPRVTFAEYLEMPEYQNIQTRMLGADSFPYRNITVTEKVFQKAMDALDHLYFIGLQEAFELSSLALLRRANVSMLPEIKKERDQSSGTGRIAKDKAALRASSLVMQRAREVNNYDLRLYSAVVHKFCKMLKSFPDLHVLLEKNEKVHCT
mmetsp:Transcript_9573/g.15777  ORF Transcript_9573/g.15777 Transcript_9573/m.15777 type:complete len:358 (+) Transcript_9573:290-1363(+)